MVFECCWYKRNTTDSPTEHLFILLAENSPLHNSAHAANMIFNTRREKKENRTRSTPSHYAKLMAECSIFRTNVGSK
jgi:hypothetical protein